MWRWWITPRSTLCRFFPLKSETFLRSPSWGLISLERGNGRSSGCDLNPRPSGYEPAFRLSWIFASIRQNAHSVRFISRSSNSALRTRANKREESVTVNGSKSRRSNSPNRRGKEKSGRTYGWEKRLYDVSLTGICLRQAPGPVVLNRQSKVCWMPGGVGMLMERRNLYEVGDPCFAHHSRHIAR